MARCEICDCDDGADFLLTHDGIALCDDCRADADEAAERGHAEATAEAVRERNWRDGWGWGCLRPGSPGAMLAAVARDMGGRLTAEQREALLAGHAAGAEDARRYVADMAANADRPLVAI